MLIFPNILNRAMRRLSLAAKNALLFSLAFFAFGLNVYAATVTWTGSAGDKDFSNGGNWNTGSIPAPGDEVQLQNNASGLWLDTSMTVGNMYTGNNSSYSESSLTLQNGSNLTATQLLLGQYVKSTLTVESGATLNTNNWLFIGRQSGGNGILEVKDGGTVNVSGAYFYVGQNGTGTVNQTGGVINISATNMFQADAKAGKAFFNISGGEFKTTTTNNFILGTRGSGTINLSDTGVFTVTGSINMAPGYESSSTGIINQTGGTLNANGGINFGGEKANTGKAQYFLSGGTLNATTIKYGNASRAPANTSIFEISGTGVANISDALAVPTNVKGGMLNADSIAIPANGKLDVSGGTIKLGAGGITAAGAYTVALSGGTLTTNEASWSSALNATVENTVTFAPEADQTITWSGVLSGTGSVTKTGAGDLTIVAGANGNTYTGGTTVSEGTLYLQGQNLGKSSVGTGDFTIESGAKVIAQSHNVFGSGSADNIPNVIINGGYLKPHNYLHLTNLDINSGTIDVHGSGDGLDFNNRNGVITSTGESSIASAIRNASTLTIDVENGTLSLTNTINNSGSGSKTIKTGAGTLTTSQWINNLLDIQEGTVKLTGTFNSNSKRFNGEVTIAAGATLDCAAKDTLGYGTANTKLHIYGTMDSSVANETLNNTELHMYGGTAKASSGSTFDILNAGVKFYSYALDGATADAPTASTISANTLLRTDGAFEINTAANSQLNMPGAITTNSGNCTVTKLGEGTLVFSGANTYTNPTSVSAGVLQLTGDAVVANGTMTVGESGTLEFNLADGQTKKLTISDQNAISGTGLIVKSGNGVLQFDAAQDSFSAGELQLRTGRLDFKGYMIGNLIVENGVFSPGNSVGTMNLTGNASITDGIALFEFGSFDSGEFDVLNILGDGNSFTSGNSMIELFFEDNDAQAWADSGNEYKLVSDDGFVPGDYSSWLGNYTDTFGLTGKSDGLYLVGLTSPDPGSGVPEPSTWALLVLGAAGMMYWRKNAQKCA